MPDEPAVRRGTPAFLIATWFGTGLLPRAPGTWGSLIALPFAWALVWAGGPWLLLAAAAALFALGIWAADRHIAATGQSDPSAVVVDEVVGQWLTLAFAPLDLLAYGLGFLLFRIFDVLKPWPVCLLDRHIKGGLGVMIDDVGAGIYAAIALFLIMSWLG